MIMTNMIIWGDVMVYYTRKIENMKKSMNDCVCTFIHYENY